MRLQIQLMNGKAFDGRAKKMALLQICSSRLLRQQQREKFEMLTTYHKIKCNMSRKIYYLHSYLGFTPHNLRAVSVEHGDGFRQDLSTLKKRYEERWDANMFG